MRFVRNQLRNHADTTKQTFAQCRLEQELFGGGAVRRRSCSEQELLAEVKINVRHVGVKRLSMQSTDA